MVKNTPEEEQWQAARSLGRTRDGFRWANPRDLPCNQTPRPFRYVMDEHDDQRQKLRATAEAKRLCEDVCPHREACLIEIMRIEVGMREGLRAGIVAGLTGQERARLANQQGCGVCGEELPEGRRLYCEGCATRGARLRALNNRRAS